jgi:hypothetical protein
MMGGAPPPAVPVASATIQPPTPGRARLQARFKGEPFTEPPPYDMSAFGDSNTP